MIVAKNLHKNNPVSQWSDLLFSIRFLDPSVLEKTLLAGKTYNVSLALLPAQQCFFFSPNIYSALIPHLFPWFGSIAQKAFQEGSHNRQLTSFLTTILIGTI